METKICTKCSIDQPIENYYTRSDGGRKRPKSICKECESKQKAKPLDVIPDLEGETWVPMVDFEDNFVISNKGRVRRIMHRKNPTNRLMTQTLNNDGYLFLSLRKNGSSMTIFIHRAVAMAFIHNSDNKRTVNHINGIKTDNQVENLEWNTHKENINHAWENGLSVSREGIKHHNTKLTEKDVLEIRAIGKSMSAVQLGSLYGINEQAIYKILSRQRWKHI